MKGVLTVVSGFSGVGKGTVVEYMRGIHPFTLSISATTRSPRPMDQEGVTYYFLSREEFAKRAEEGYFLEWAKYTDNCYGTPKAPVLEAIERGEDVVLEIEAQGARQIKEQYPDALLIFVLPPDFYELKARLEGRKTETPERIKARLSRAIEEFDEIPYYDHIVVNETIEQCADDILSRIESKRSTPDWQKDFIARLRQEADRVMEEL